jgi:hypothetical protein
MVSAEHVPGAAVGSPGVEVGEDVGGALRGADVGRDEDVLAAGEPVTPGYGLDTDFPSSLAGSVLPATFGVVHGFSDHQR